MARPHLEERSRLPAERLRRAVPGGRPEAGRVLRLHDALDGQGDRRRRLAKADREPTVVATQRRPTTASDRVVAHGPVARIRAGDLYLADQVAVDRRKAPLAAPAARGAARSGACRLAVDAGRR